MSVNSIQPTWRIEWMKAVPQVAGAENIIVECGWRCTLVQDMQSVSAYGSASFSIPENVDDSFTPFDQLSESQVLDWIWGGKVDRESIETGLTRQLEELVNPSIVQVSLPWAQQPNTDDNIQPSQSV